MTHIGQLFFGLQPNELVPILSIVQENMLQQTKILYINSNEKKITGKMCSNFNGIRFLALRNNLYKLNFIGFAEPRKVAETGSSQFMSLVLIKMT